MQETRTLHRSHCNAGELRFPKPDCRIYDIRTVQELLGHADVSTTMIYTHVLQRGACGARDARSTACNVVGGELLDTKYSSRRLAFGHHFRYALYTSVQYPTSTFTVDLTTAEPFTLRPLLGPDDASAVRE